MERALEIFYEEFLVWKKATLEKYNEAKIDFNKLKKQVDEHGMSKEVKNALYMCQHELSRIAYMLMEAHLRLHNCHSLYSEEQQKEINSYDKVSEKVGKLLKEISEYREDFQNPADRIL